jgi:two-component system OmpR family sensor kinase
MPLRIKLITAVLTLVAIALAVISLVGIGVLRSNLLSNADQTLAAVSGQVTRELGISGIPPARVAPRVVVGEAVTWAPDHGSQQKLIVPVSASGYAQGQNTQLLPGPSISDAASLPSNPGNAITVGSTSGGARWRVVGIPSIVTQPNGSQVQGVLVVATNASSVYQTIGSLTAIDLVVSLVVIVILAGVGVALVRASLRPLTEIEQTAGAIAAGDLSRRVPERDPGTEVGRLGRSLNAMLSQIESAFLARSRSEAAARRSEERMRQFVADASHELRTPLTAIRGFAEYYRQRGGVTPGAEPTDQPSRPGVAQVHNGQLAPADLDRIMRRVEQESARMGVLVEDMLLLARLDQQRPLEHNTVDLLTLAADAVHDARVVAPNRKVNLTVGAGAALLVIGDEVRLRQVIGNLMSNALAHTPDGTAIDVRIRSGTVAEIQAATAAAARRRAAELKSEQAAAGDDLIDQGQSGEGPEVLPGAWPGAAASTGMDSEYAANAQTAAVLEVTDYGPGLTEEQAAHAFERFYRADQARTAGGTGLGLAIVAALVSAHGGALWVQSEHGHGATFSIALPLAPEAVQGPGEHDDEPLGEVADDETEGRPEDPTPGTAWMGSAPGGSARGTA